ncbi:FMN-binding protein [Chitinispirillales bacterium ANBcel5]|uniref:FMN-binding protein n=1 Tax=Cellulosispirillum alkaliphilum TaxID=3039283 RepID=UPI002A58C130|nr:FMN-binding protein [Chitinispirillales bacterium ANBcel5]
MTDVIKLALALMAISLVAGLAIGITNHSTREQIAYQNELIQKQSLQAVFPEGITIKEKSGEGILPSKYWVGVCDDGEVLNYAFEVSRMGYSGDIKYMVGVDPEGTITGMTILEQQETPGLGSRVEEVASSEYIWTFLFSSSEENEPWFTEQFKGLSALLPITINNSSGEWHNLDQDKRNELKENNSVTAITGSTISTNAVVSGVEEKVKSYVKALKGTE